MTRSVGIVFALVAALASRDASADVPWRSGALEPVLDAARVHRHLVLVDFAAVWCGPCQRMDATVWNRADVATGAAAYEPLRVDSDTPIGQALRTRYHVGALPTVLALRADGTELDRITGESDATTLLAALDAWQRGGNTLSVLEAHVAAHPDDLGMRLELGGRYADRGDVDAATAHLRAVIAGDANNAHQLAAPALLALGDRLYLRARRDPVHAIAPLEELLHRFPATPQAAGALMPLATAYHRAARDADARALLDRYLAAAPHDARSDRANEVAWMMFREHWDLGHAEQVARAGVDANPNDAALLDTLAEIVFARARAAEAVEIERRAARADPTSAYYARQIARFAGASTGPTP